MSSTTIQPKGRLDYLEFVPPPFEKNEQSKQKERFQKLLTVLQTIHEFKTCLYRSSDLPRVVTNLEKQLERYEQLKAHYISELAKSNFEFLNTTPSIDLEDSYQAQFSLPYETVSEKADELAIKLFEILAEVEAKNEFIVNEVTFKELEKEQAEVIAKLIKLIDPIEIEEIDFIERSYSLYGVETPYPSYLIPPPFITPGPSPSDRLIRNASSSQSHNLGSSNMTIRPLFSSLLASTQHDGELTSDAGDPKMGPLKSYNLASSIVVIESLFDSMLSPTPRGGRISLISTTEEPEIEKIKKSPSQQTLTLFDELRKSAKERKKRVADFEKTRNSQSDYAQRLNDHKKRFDQLREFEYHDYVRQLESLSNMLKAASEFDIIPKQSDLSQSIAPLAKSTMQDMWTAKDPKIALEDNIRLFHGVLSYIYITWKPFLENVKKGREQAKGFEQDLTLLTVQKEKEEAAKLKKETLDAIRLNFVQAEEIIKPINKIKAMGIIKTESKNDLNAIDDYAAKADALITAIENNEPYDFYEYEMIKRITSQFKEGKHLPDKFSKTTLGITTGEDFKIEGVATSVPSSQSDLTGSSEEWSVEEEDDYNSPLTRSTIASIQQGLVGNLKQKKD
jgi:hypothetical protein